MATSHLPSRVRKKGRNCYVTPALLGIPNTKHADNIRSGYLTHAFSGTQRRAKLLCYPTFSGIPDAKGGENVGIGGITLAFWEVQKRAELLRNPCIYNRPQRQARGENHKWLPNPCLLQGSKEGGIAT